MELCDQGHDEVCYTSRECPVCVLINNHNEEMADAKTRFESLEDDYFSLREGYKQLEKEMATYPADFIRWEQVKGRIKGE